MTDKKHNNSKNLKNLNKGEFVPVEEIALRLACSPRTARRRVVSGDIPSITIGPRQYVPRERFEAQLRG
jgi:hypothetical protein